MYFRSKSSLLDGEPGYSDFKTEPSEPDSPIPEPRIKLYKEGDPEATIDNASIEAKGIDRESLPKALENQEIAIQSCYEEALKREASLRGKLKIGYRVAKTGAPEGVKVEPSGFLDPKLVECTKKAAAAWKLPAPEGEATVSYSVGLVPGKAGE